jgi:hypothetical protein
MLLPRFSWQPRAAAFKITDENNGLAKAVYQATLKLSVPRAIRRIREAWAWNVHQVSCGTMTGLRRVPTVPMPEVLRLRGGEYDV